MKFLVATRGLAYVENATSIEGAKKIVKRFKRLGYKKPLVYWNVKLKHL